MRNFLNPFFSLQKRKPSASSNVIHQMLVTLYDRKDKVTQFATGVYGHVEIPGSELPMCRLAPGPRNFTHPEANPCAGCECKKLLEQGSKGLQAQLFEAARIYSRDNEHFYVHRFIGPHGRSSIECRFSQSVWTYNHSLPAGVLESKGRENKIVIRSVLLQRPQPASATVALRIPVDVRVEEAELYKPRRRA